MKSQALYLLLVVTIFSCNSNRNTQTTTDTITSVDSPKVDTLEPRTPNAVVDKLVVNKTPKLFKGLYTYGDEVNTFQECGNTSKVYWVNDSISSLRKSYQKATEFLSYPYESVYAEVEGYLAGKSQMGYASEYKNVLVVTSIKKIQQKSYKTACYNYEFIALGNEPFWSVDIMPLERKIILKYAGKEKVYEFPYQSANIGGGVYRFETKNTKNDKLAIVIRKEKCSDGMSDRVYNYSAEVVINGETLKGCAIKKGDTID